MNALLRRGLADGGVNATTVVSKLLPRLQPQSQTTREMSKFISKSAKKRLNLTTKRARKGFYKGKGGTTEGRHTSKGKYIIDPLKQLELVVPDLTGFKLKPYIAASASKFPPEQRRGQAPS